MFVPHKNQALKSAAITLLSIVSLLKASQASQPVVLKRIEDRVILTNATSPSYNLAEYVKADPATNLVRVTTTLKASNGSSLGFTLRLFPTNSPKTVANFLAYLNDGAYENMLIHRSVPGFVIQTGGYGYSGNAIPTWTNIVPSEASNGLSNIRGTVAMALVGSDSNSATSQWFINLTNNAATLDSTNIVTNPPFTVFAQVLGNGMTTVDAVAALPRFNFGAPFDEVPVKTTNVTSYDDLAHISRVATIPYLALSSDSGAYAPRISNSILYIDYTGGTNPPTNPVTISLIATDTNGLTTNTSFQVWHLSNQVRTIHYPVITNQPYTTNPFYLPYWPTNSDGTDFSGQITPTGPLGFKDGNAYFTGTGTLTLTYVQPGNTFFRAASNSASFVIGKAPQNIVFPQISPQVYGTNPLPVPYPAKTSAGNPVQITIASNSPVRSVGGRYFVSGVGTATLIATQSGTNPLYFDATPVTNTFTISPARQTISFPALSNQVLPVAPLVLNARASSGLQVSYSLSSNSPATLTNGNTLRITGPGTITIVASQTGTNLYLPASPVTNSFRAASNQTLGAFGRIPKRTFTNPAESLVIANPPQASSGLPVTYSVKAGPASILSTNSNSLTISILGAGTVTLSANQTGNSNYFSREVTTSFIVNKAPQFIAPFSGLPSTLTNGTAPITVNIPQASSGLTNTVLRVSGAGTLSSSNTISLTNAGTLTITATNAGNSNYLASSLSTNITVLKGFQSITFPGTNVECEAGKTYLLSATSSSGLPITYRLIPSNTPFASVSGSSLTIRAVTTNSIGIVATQSGNSGYNAAVPVTNSFTIIANQDGSSSGGSISMGNPNPTPTPGGNGWIIR